MDLDEELAKLTAEGKAASAPPRNEALDRLTARKEEAAQDHWIAELAEALAKSKSEYAQLAIALQESVSSQNQKIEAMIASVSQKLTENKNATEAFRGQIAGEIAATQQSAANVIRDLGGKLQKISDAMVHNINASATNAANAINCDTEKVTAVLRKVTGRRNIMDLVIIFLALLAAADRFGFFTWAHGAIVELIHHAPAARK